MVEKVQYAPKRGAKNTRAPGGVLFVTPSCDISRKSRVCLIYLAPNHKSQIYLEVCTVCDVTDFIPRPLD